MEKLWNQNFVESYYNLFIKSIDSKNINFVLLL